MVSKRFDNRIKEGKGIGQAVKKRLNPPSEAATPSIAFNSPLNVTVLAAFPFAFFAPLLTGLSSSESELELDSSESSSESSSSLLSFLFPSNSLFNGFVASTSSNNTTQNRGKLENKCSTSASLKPGDDKFSIYTYNPNVLASANANDDLPVPGGPLNR